MNFSLFNLCPWGGDVVHRTERAVSRRTSILFINSSLSVAERKRSPLSAAPSCVGGRPSVNERKKKIKEHRIRWNHLRLALAEHQFPNLYIVLRPLSTRPSIAQSTRCVLLSPGTLSDLARRASTFWRVRHLLVVRPGAGSPPQVFTSWVSLPARDIRASSSYLVRNSPHPTATFEPFFLLLNARGSLNPLERISIGASTFYLVLLPQHLSAVLRLHRPRQLPGPALGFLSSGIRPTRVYLQSYCR